MSTSLKVLNSPGYASSKSEHALVPPGVPSTGRSSIESPDGQGSDGQGSATAYEVMKTVMDLALAFLLLGVFAPVIAVAAAAVRLTSSGPAFYTQTRVGKGGRLFRIYKLRTMHHNVERTSGIQWATPSDPRITRVGQFLRQTHIDELPQLLNVLRLEMSLVGPRPERPEIIPVLEGAIPNYRDRLRVRPGVTGLAQLRLPPDTDIPGVGRKLAYDLFYIRSVGPWLDLRLLGCTSLKMAGIPLTPVLWVCRVPGHCSVGLTDKPNDASRNG
jgi:lipopolysaccharide/colanic/teichoic acid biosynthesis glycosyltransferase